MVSITSSLNQETKEMMNRFPEINWSGFIRKCIEEKVGQLSWKEKMLKKLKQDEAFEEWAVDMGRKVNKDIAKRLKNKGFLEE